MILINGLSISFRATLAPVVRVAFIICVLLSRERKEASETIIHSAARCPPLAPNPSFMSDKLSIVIKDFSGGWYARL